MNIVLYILTYFFYRTINKRREAIWNAWSPKVSLTINWSYFYILISSANQQQQDYVETTEDQGNQRLDFRFVY